MSRGDTDGAAKSIASSLALIEPVWNGKQDEALRLQLAQTRLLQGAIAQRTGQLGEAKSAWNEARALLVDDPTPEVAFDRLDPLVRALLLLGRGSEAVPYRQRLMAAGYVPLQRWPDAASAFAAVAQAHRTNTTNAGR